MKKIVLIVFLSIISVIVVLVILRGHNSVSNINNGTSAINTTGSLPTVDATTSNNNFPIGSTLTIGTPEGSVTMNNFYNNPEQISADHTSILIESTSTYNITYYAPDSSFNILISAKPVESIQAEAETAFLQALGISKNDACKLNVSIGIPESVDPNYANENVGLSFCATNGAFQAP